MKYGFIKTASVSSHIIVADIEYNKELVLDAIQKFSSKGAEIIVFPQLTLTGNTCGDIFFQSALLQGAENALLDILNRTSLCSTVCVIGLPMMINGGLYDVSAVIQNGLILGLVPSENKTRYFSQAPKDYQEVEFAGKWVPFYSRLQFRLNNGPCFTVVKEDENPERLMNSACMNLIPGSSNELVGKAKYRDTIFAAISKIEHSAIVYAGAGEGESTTDLVFSGHCIISENGKIISESKPFGEHFAVCEIDVERLQYDREKSHYCPVDNHHVIPVKVSDNIVDFNRNIPSDPFIPDEKETLKYVFDMQVSGLCKRINHTNTKCCLIGISGGLDSALALLVTVGAYDKLNKPREEIVAVTMPCFGTTKRTKTNAELLCKALGVSFKEVNITDSVKSHFIDIGQKMDNLDVTFENAQARERTQVLMDMANQMNGMVIGTGDLSELALGWATYNGDHMSMYGVNASVPKTLIRHIVAYYADKTVNYDASKALVDILNTPVSPELLPAKDGKISQETEDIVGPYELHDFFLFYMIRYGFAPDKIYFLAKQSFAGKFDENTIKKWLRIFVKRFFAQQFKRSCVPDGPKVGTVSLSPRGDFCMPSDASGKLWLSIIDTL